MESSFIDYDPKSLGIINQDDKYKKFKRWFRQNGGLQKSITFPSRFQPGNYLGLSASQQIPPNTVILAVPKQLTISLSTAKDSQLQHIISHHRILCDSTNQDRDYNVICLFLIMEKMKGKQSFYYPYIELLDSSETLMNWEEGEIQRIISDPYLHVKFVSAVKRTFDPVFKIFKEITMEHRDVFPHVLDRKMFDEMYAAVMTRGFGWGLPETMLVPYADFLNHSCSGVNHYVFDRVLQERGQKGEYVHKKYELDLRLFQGIDNSKLLPTDYKRNIRQNYIHQHLQQVKRLGLSYDDNSRMDTTFSDTIYHKLTQLVVEDNFDDEVNLSSDSEDNDSEQQQDQDYLEVEDSDGEQENQYRVNTQKEEIQQKNNHQPKSLDKFKDILMVRKYMKYVYQLVNQELFSNFTQPKPMINCQFEDDVKFDWWYQSTYNKSKVNREIMHKSGQQNEEKLLQGKYFIVSTSKRIHRGQQIYNCYGRRSNRFLLTWYGFCFQSNKYDSVPFRIWSSQVTKLISHRTWTNYLTDIQYSKGIPIGNERFNAMMLSEEFRLKKRRIDYRLLAYLRFGYLKAHRVYRQYYKENRIHVNKMVALQMEGQCFGVYRQLLGELRCRFGVDDTISRFKQKQRQRQKQSHNSNRQSHQTNNQHNSATAHMIFADILAHSNADIILRNLLAVNEIIVIIDTILRDFTCFINHKDDNKKQRVKWCTLSRDYLKTLYQKTFTTHLIQPSDEFRYLIQLEKGVSPRKMVVQLKLMVREYFRHLAMGEVADTLETEFQ